MPTATDEKPTAAAPAAPAAAPAAAATPAPAAPATGTTPATPAPAATGTVLTSDKPAATEAQGDKPAAPAVPDTYEFKAAEGAQVDTKLAGEVGTLAKELGLSQEAAQKLYERDAGRIAALQAEAKDQLLEASRTTWLEELKADKDLGGTKFVETAEIAKRAVETFGTPALKQILNETGLGNHPELVRTFAKIGRLLADDTLTPPGPPSGTKPRLADRLFGAATKSQE